MADLQYVLESEVNTARLGILKTPHGSVETPVFMPVGTQGAVKSLFPRDVWETGTRIILSNAYHLYLRPGPSVVEKAGGLHAFMGWPGAILTDSGGFQILSLGHLVSISDQEAVFRSHIDGSLVRFSPEDSVRAQVSIGADIIMCLDQCTPYPISRDLAKDAVRRTILWAKRSRQIEIPDKQALFGIVQGSTYPDLRKECAMELAALDFPGYAIGGLSVGEPKEEFYEVLAQTVQYLPKDRPRYLMGVGHPVDLIEGVLAGVDMFDCVLPTRNARHGRAFTFQGPLNLRNARFTYDFGPLEEGCDCPTCAGFSRAYIRHLFVAGESLAWTLLSVHNLRFFQRFMARLRESLKAGTVQSFREEIERLYPV
ncbi:MAG TPA: tRNA guanosine(34) transglycosylase Tgt [Firmicutes bacterium]|nr:tRNA guanosine(34) transglycosylase Tgt [Candidatus Fermentithermobacillaceae bacterium]